MHVPLSRGTLIWREVPMKLWIDKYWQEPLTPLTASTSELFPAKLFTLAAVQTTFWQRYLIVRRWPQFEEGQRTSRPYENVRDIMWLEMEDKNPRPWRFLWSSINSLHLMAYSVEDIVFKPTIVLVVRRLPEAAWVDVVRRRRSRNIAVRIEGTTPRGSCCLRTFAHSI